MTPEGRVKAAVKKVLKKHGIYYFMPVQTGYGTQGLDFYCCIMGEFVAIETKAPGQKLTARQAQTTKIIKQSKGTVLVIDSVEKAQELSALIVMITLDKLAHDSSNSKS